MNVKDAPMSAGRWEGPDQPVAQTGDEAEQAPEVAKVAYEEDQAGDAAKVPKGLNVRLRIRRPDNTRPPPMRPERPRRPVATSTAMPARDRRIVSPIQPPCSLPGPSHDKTRVPSLKAESVEKTFPPKQRDPPTGDARVRPTMPAQRAVASKAAGAPPSLRNDSPESRGCSHFSVQRGR